MASISTHEFPLPQPTTASLARLHREVGQSFYEEIWAAVVTIVEIYWKEPAPTLMSSRAAVSPRVDFTADLPDQDAPRHTTVPDIDPLRDPSEPVALRSSSWAKQTRVDESIFEMWQDLHRVLPEGVWARHMRAIKDMVCRAHRAVLTAIEAENDQEDSGAKTFVHLTSEDLEE